MVNRNEALRRAARLQGQRGAAVFLVVMVITLLTAMGVFAVRSTSLADAAAGFDREGAQASLVAQYGITATAAYVGTGVSGTIVSAMRPTLGMPKCESNGYPMTVIPYPDLKDPCYRMAQADLQTSFTASSNETIFAPTNSGVTSGTSSLNVNEKTDATFNVEFTDLATTGFPLAASGPDWVQYELTLTSIAQVRPLDACAASNPLPATPNAAQTVVRSVITLGGPSF